MNVVRRSALGLVAVYNLLPAEVVKLTTVKDAGACWGWKPNAFLVREWGEAKFMNKLKSGKSLAQGDPDTGLEDD